MNQIMFVEQKRVLLPPITNLPLPESQALFFKMDLSPVCEIARVEEPIIEVTESSAPSELSDQASMKPCKVGKGFWTPQEDKMLLDAMAIFSGHICWEELSKLIPGRTAKQCRERWQFRLHPDVKKDPFEPWEDELILRERQNCGNHWALIASMLPGRTSCSVKNRWYTVLRNRKEKRVYRPSRIGHGKVSQYHSEAVVLRDSIDTWKKSKQKFD